MKYIISMTIGAMILPIVSPNFIHSKFKGKSIFEFRSPKIKKIIEINKGIIFISTKLPLKDHNAIIKNTTKNTKPKFLFDGILFFIYFILF